MTGSVELEIPWGKFPNQTPQGQKFTPEQLGAMGTPLGFKVDAGDDGIDAIRKYIAEVMNDETFLCPIAEFLKHYGPVTNIKQEDIDACRQHLVDAKLLLELPNDTFRWRDFQFNPSRYSNKEKRVFDDLVHIVEAINDYASTKGDRPRGNNYNFVTPADNNIEGDIGGTTHRLDGCAVESEYKEGKLPVRFIIAPHEYKKERTAKDQKEVREQAVGDSHHILCDDVRRMFIYAVTIEDTRMSLWYFSRSHSVKALSFEWTEKNIDTFIHVFLAFAYATPEQLGVDPTVHFAPRDPKAKLVGPKAPAQQYIYQHEVKKGVFKYFKTVHAIKDMRPYNISGRNTRVWSVVEVKGPQSNEEVTGERLVLKDVWLDETRKTEAENMDLIFEAIEALIAKSIETWGDEWKDRLVKEDPRFSKLDIDSKNRLQYFLTNGNYKSLFLTKLFAWKGALSKKLSPDALNTPAGVDIFPKKAGRLIQGKEGRTLAGSGVPSQSQSRQPPGPHDDDKAAQKEEALKRKSRRDFKPKQQSRVVYKEVCQDLDTVGTLGNLMDLINQALDALRIMYCAQWVHRDISLKNILAFKDNNGVWKVKLADLEFSQKLISDVRRTDPRTGTPFYMPFEIMTRSYQISQFLKEKNPENSMAEYFDLDEGTPDYERYKTITKFITRAKGIPSTATDQIPKADDFVRYNYQHDLESIWWIVFYAITALVDYKISKDYSLKVFQRSRTLPEERGFAWLWKFTIRAEPHIHPALAEPFSDLMENLRTRMHEECLTRGMFGQLHVDESYAAIHQYFALQLKKFLEKNEGNWKATPIAPNGQFLHGTKRAADRDDDDEQPATATESAPRDPKRMRRAAGDAN